MYKVVLSGLVFAFCIWGTLIFGVGFVGAVKDKESPFSGVAITGAIVALLATLSVVSGARFVMEYLQEFHP